MKAVRFSTRGAKGATLLLVLLMGATPTRAQERAGRHLDEQHPVPAGVEPLLRAREVRRSGASLHDPDARRDARTGVERARYRFDNERDLLPAGRAIDRQSEAALEEGALRYLTREAIRFGVADAASTLRAERVVRTRHSAHVTFQQVVDGVPVLGRYVHFSFGADGAPAFVVNGYDVDVARTQVSVSRPAVTDARARIVATGLFGVEAGAAHSTEYVVVPAENPYPAWRVLLLADAFPGDWEVLVDARTGEATQVRDLSLRRRVSHAVAVSPPAQGRQAPSVGALNAGTAGVPGAFAPFAPFGASGSARVDGTGNAFEPDPLTSAGVFYGSPFLDAEDADIPALNAQLFEVTLRDITLGPDSRYRLDGPYVRIVGGGALGYVAPSEATSAGFAYTRANDGFEAVNAYHHVDQSQRYVQSLGFTGIQASGVLVNPQALAGDNSLYLPSVNQLNFGVGHVDDAEDAGVIWHEYGHALLQASAPGLVSADSESRALHEGWADYWAGSYLRGLVEAGKSARLDWESVFRWDSGDGEIWAGRTIGVPGVYPDDTRCDDGDGCDIYADGLLWASTLMEVYDELGKTITDRLNLQSHRYLTAPASFRDAAEALLQADEDLYGGANNVVLVDRLTARGYLEGSSLAPAIDHTPLQDSEQVGGSVEVVAFASSPVSTIDSVRVAYRLPDESADRFLILSPQDGLRFAALLQLPATTGTVAYQVEAYDTEGRMKVLPEGAPSERYTFFVGPDITPPEIDHDPVQVVSTITWPPVVSTRARDNLGLQSVVVHYALRSSGIIQQSGTENMVLVGQPDIFQATLPIERSYAVDGSTIEYAIVVTDRAQAANEERDPIAGVHISYIRSTGTLLSWGFEDEAADVSATGEWELGAPLNPLTVAHSGLRAWSTSLAAPYAAEARLSSLTLPRFDLSGTNAYLIFWHWYDLEHAGDVRPGEPNPGGILWDGGNVKISVDNGPWGVVQPEGGYTGPIASGGGNPLSGQAGFGGYSFGWRREVVPLPSSPDVRVRFDFGTDGGNAEESLAYGGWFIDDVSVVTTLDVDTDPPTWDIAPPASIVKRVGSGSTDLTVRAQDDTGIERVELVVDAGSDLALPPTLLPMSLSDIDVYETSVSVPDAAAGDALLYRIRVVDYADNETLIPPASEEPYRIDYRTVESRNALSAAIGNGGWQRFGSTWRAERPEGDLQERSGLLLTPIPVATNAEDVLLVMTHRYIIDESSGANLKISVDDGGSWEVLEPRSGYGSVWTGPGGHTMYGEPIFRGARATVVDTFDVPMQSGQPVRVRLDAGFSGTSAAGSYWSIESLSVETVSAEQQIERERILSLDANFPDPFSTTTTVTYSLPEDGVVRVSLFDILGRRVRVLQYQNQVAGTHTYQLAADGLADGVYFVQLEAGGRRLVERVVVVR